MNWLRSKLFLCCLLVIVGATVASAQDWPLPAAVPNTNVPCAGCSGTRAGKLTPGYPTVLNFLGRFADNEATTDYQEAFRTGRARGAWVAPERNRVYLLIGSALAAYNIDTFFSRVTAHAALSPATQVPGNAGQRSQGAELFLYWDRYFYAEHGGGWVTPPSDGQDRLFRSGIDWDDRNICYLAYDIYGWGMVLDPPGVADGGLMQNLSPIDQFLPGTGDLVPISLVNVKTTDGSYYVLVSDQSDASRMQEWNVTDVHHVVKMPDQRGRSVAGFAKNSTGSRIGIVQLDFAAKIYTADALALGQAPIQTVPLPNGGYFALDSDGTNFYFLGKANSQGVFTVMSPNTNGGYDRADYPIRDDAGNAVVYNPIGIRAGNGLLAIFGTELSPLFSQNVRLYKLANGVPTQISLDNVVNGKHGPFFAQYYGAVSPGDNFAHPDRTILMDVTPYKYNGKTYILYAGNGIGDVWEVRSGDSLNGSLKSIADLPNPNSKAPPSSGPYYGDRQTFTSSLTSGNATAVNWAFDDGTTGSTAAGTNDIKHQFGGVTTTAALPATRHATATNVADNSMTATVAVTLAKPTVRFALNGTSFLFVQPDASSAAPIVSSDSFNDGSDGAVEGHYTEWVLDGASTKKLPSDLFSAGTCGVHTLNFVGHYGAYSGTGAGMASVGSDFPIAIGDTSNHFNYAARPFAVSVQPPAPLIPGAPPGNAVFTASARATSTAADLPAGAATPITYLWELVNAAGTTLQHNTGAATLATIPQYSLDRSVFNTPGSKVRLTLTAAASALGGACVPYAVATSITDPLNAPDPTIVPTGCGNAGAPCSFSVSSSGSQAGWSYAWSITNNSAISTTSTFAPTIATGGTYTVTLIVTNAIGLVTKTSTFNVAQPLCSDAPTSDNTAFAGTCVQTQCSQGDSVTFRIFPFQYTLDPACDTATWNFGDSSTSGPGTDYTISHSYVNNGTYTITLVLRGGTSTANLTSTITIGSVNQQPTPPNPQPQGSCAPQTSDSGYLGFLGPQSSCVPGGASCSAGEMLSFALYSTTYNFDCSTPTYLWDFGDSTQSGDRFAQHTYAAANTYHVTLSVTNTGGTGVYSTDVQVGGGTQPTPPNPTPPQPCGDLSTQTISLHYTGNGCTEAGGDCVSTTAVAFVATPTGYDFSCGTHSFDWDYGDSSAHGTTASASHSYAGPGTFTAKLTVGYGDASITLSKSVHVVAPTGGSGNCPLMIADTNVYIVYSDPSNSQCSSLGGSCSIGAAVQFRAMSYPSDFGCSPTFSWDFGDTNASTLENPVHAYSQNGTYQVKLTVTNTQQTITLSKTIVVGTGVTVPPRHRATRQ